jgi:hypothetical protein
LGTQNSVAGWPERDLEVVPGAMSMPPQSGMRSVINNFLPLSWDFLISLIQGIRYRQLFKNVRTYCMFVGYPRSGHSLLGALLDAHPNIMIAHELNALKYIRAGFGKFQLFWLLYERSRQFTAKGNTWSGYSYQVPGQWQGKSADLQIIGDKKGGISAHYFFLYPSLFNRLMGILGPQVKVIHVIRHPLDVIATMKIKGPLPTIAENVDQFYNLCEGVSAFKQKTDPDNWFEIKLETFISSPSSYLSSLCRFLSVDVSEGYLNSCAGIVYKSPNLSRNQIDWKKSDLAVIESRSKQFDYLGEYGFRKE